MRIIEIEDTLPAESMDADLIKSTLSGDNSAFEKLVLRYQRRVYRLVYRIVNNYFDASDIVQETFIKAYKGLAYLKNPDRFSSWLYQIAKNHCTDWLRQKRDDLISIEKEITLDCLNLPATPDEILIENELHEQVMKAIAELPEHSREAVRMFYIDGKSYAEIQEELGIKKGTLARWLYEARLRLSKVAQQFSFIFVSLLRKTFYQLPRSISSQALSETTAVSISKCLVTSIILHVIIFSQIGFRDTNFISSHSQSYHNTFIQTSLTNDLPVENLPLQIDSGKIPIARASGVSNNTGLKRFDIYRHKESIISASLIYPEMPKPKQQSPLSEKPYSKPQMLSDVRYQYVGYKPEGFTSYLMDAPRVSRTIELNVAKQNQPVSIANPETPDDNEAQSIMDQALGSNEYELVRFLFEKPNKEIGYPSKFAIDKQGNIYISDMINSRIMKLSSDGTLLTSWGEKGHDDGQFRWPCGIAVDESGNVYVADSGNYRIQKFDSNGAFLAKWGSKGYVFGTENYKDYKDPSRFKRPIDVAIDDLGYIYVVDAGEHCVCKFTSDGKQIRKWGEKGSREGQFRTPTSIAVDKSGNIYVADGENHRIQKFGAEGRFIAKWGTMGIGDGKFKLYCEIGIDNSGNALVVDGGNNRIQKFDPSGRFLTKWGRIVHGYDHYWRGERNVEPDDGFVAPSDIAVDDQGDIYVLDGWRIKVFRQKSQSPIE